MDPIDDNLPEGPRTVVADDPAPGRASRLHPPRPIAISSGAAPGRAYILRQRPKSFAKAGNCSSVRLRCFPVAGAGHRNRRVPRATPMAGYRGCNSYANHHQIGEQQIHFIIRRRPVSRRRFSMMWSNVPPGSYVLTAKVTDNQGGISLTDPVQINVVDAAAVAGGDDRAIDPVAVRAESDYRPRDGQREFRVAAAP